MNPEELESELRALLAGRCRLDVSDLDPDADLVRELGLDSLARLRLLAAVEQRLEVRFEDARLGEIRTLRELAGAVAEAMKTKGGAS